MILSKYQRHVIFIIKPPDCLTRQQLSLLSLKNLVLNSETATLSQQVIILQKDKSSLCSVYFKFMNKENKKSGGIDMYGTIIRANQSLVRENAYDEKRIEKMYQYPANLNEAQLHNFANKFGYNSKYITGKQKAPLCPCCELPVNTVNIDLDYPTTPSQANVKAGAEKYKLNAGTSMLFTFIKMTIVYLGLRFFITDGYNLITNIFAQNCKDPKNISQCSTNFAAKFSNFNKSTNSDQIYLFIVDILNIITVVLSIIFFTIYRKYQYTIYCLADMSTHTQADYTIFVERIPIILPKNFGNNRVSLDDCDYQSQLKNIFEKYIRQWLKKIEQQTKEHPKNPNLNKLELSLLDVQRAHPNFAYQPIVTSITLCFDLTQLEKLNYLREELMEKHKQNIHNNISEDKNSQMYIPNQIEALNKEIIKLSKKFADQNSASFNLSHFVGKAFISFQYQHYKQYFLEYFQLDNKIKMLDNVLKISTAAEPSDVYWYNMRILSSQRTKSVIYSYLIMAVSLIISFGLLFGLEYYQLVISTKSIQTQLSVKTTKQIILSYSFTMLMTVSTTAINYILSFVIQKVTEFEKQKTKTDQIISLITKTVAAQFLNTAVIYYIISIAATNFLPPEKNSPLSETGLVMKVTSLIAVSGFIQIMTNFVQFGQIFSSIMNKCKYSKQTTTNSFQVELNKLLQPTQFSFALRYSYYILNVYVVSFYSYIVPYISLILIVIFAIQYWVDKFNLFKRFSCPTDFNYRLSMFTLKIFECSIFFFALGNFLFAPTIHTNNRGSDYRIINIVSVSLALAYCLAIFFLPKKWLQKVSHQTFESVSYQTCIKQLYFNKVYWLLNPATTFANEPNINKPQQLIDYGQAINFAEESDFVIFDNLVNQQNVKQDQDVYSPEEFRNFAEVLANNDLIKNYDNGDDNIFAQLAAASK